MESYTDPAGFTDEQIARARELAAEQRGEDLWERLDTVVRERYCELVAAKDAPEAA